MFVLPYFALTLFASATLLFLVQPMIGKMILPRLGGTPAVWNTCMVFFQAVLLLGYGYTHFVTTRLSRRAQLALQSVILLAPFAVLPFTLGQWKPPGDSNPILSVLGILLVVVGVPFFVVSTTAPLLQRWFAFTGHPSAKDPYFLYGASNLGSMLALVLYPVLIEPNFALSDQARVWTGAYACFACLVAGCVVMLWSKSLDETPTVAPTPAPAPEATTAPIAASKRTSRLLLDSTAAPESPVAASAQTSRLLVESATSESARASELTWARRLRWIGLSAVPSSLMLGTTTYLTTDIAAIPFFWVLPLALYLATFILVFARWPVVWTEPRTKPSGPAAMPFLTMLAGWALVAVGVIIHLVLPEYRNPLELGPSHGFYAVAAILFFVYWIASGTGGPHDFVLYFQPCFLLFLVLKFVAGLNDTPTWLTFALHLFSFLFITLMCHGELARDRPTAKHLTEFYLWMSVGGVVGGLANALVAPLVFRWGLIEYPLAMVVACFLRPNLVTDATLLPGDSRKGQPTPTGYGLDVVLPLVIMGLAATFAVVDEESSFSHFLHTELASLAVNFFGRDPDTDFRFRSFLMAIPVVATLALAMRPLRFGAALGLLWLAVGWADKGRYVFQDRGFFGMVRVRESGDSGTGSRYNTLIHGGIDHGRQHIDPLRKHEPCSYFHPLNGIGQIFMKLTWPNTPVPANLNEFNTLQTPYREFRLPSWRIPASLAAGSSPWAALATAHSEPPFAVIGLGTGTLAAFAKPYQPVDIYEIDPLVLQLSQRGPDGKAPAFTYLEDATKRGAHLRVILGDGRLKVEEAPEHWYHVICLDAFSSDAIPVHLLTVEAVELYLKKLAPGGVLVFNATNKFVDITGVLRDIGDRLGLECWSLPDWHSSKIPEKYGTDFVILRRTDATAEQLGVTFVGGPSIPRRVDQERWRSLTSSLYGRNDTDHYAWRETPKHDGRVWTDAYSNLLGVLKWGK